MFYKRLAADLPPIIVGSGIVIASENNNSTVKVIESALPVESGCKAVLLHEVRRTAGPEEPGVVTEDMPKEMEEIPAIELRDKADGSPAEDTLEMDVLFDLNKTSIKDQYKKDFQKIKEFIDAKSEYAIILRGYACNIGGLEYNLKLSKKRVDSVKKYLMENYKIKEEFFETYHYGEKDTPHKNVSEEQRKKNRLVNIEVIGK